MYLFIIGEYKMNCPKCGSSDIRKAGIQYRAKGKCQRYLCKNCGHIFLGEMLNE